MMHFVLNILAQLHPKLRNSFSLRVANKLHSLFLTKSTKTIHSNFGIDARLKLEIPIINANPFYLYGKPYLYRGERALLVLASRLMQSKTTFLDIGGNWGYFSFVVNSKCPNKRIIYVEPIKHLVEFMQKATRANGLNNIEILPVAINNVSGKVEFYQNLSDDFSSSLSNHFAAIHQTQIIEVEAKSFDDLLAEQSIDLKNTIVKVDVENAEWLFIEGAKNSLSQIDFLLMEVLGPAVQSDFLQTMIQKHGFHAYYINDYVLEYSVDGSFEYCSPEYNWLFCRKKPAELALELGLEYSTNNSRLILNPI